MRVPLQAWYDEWRREHEGTNLRDRKSYQRFREREKQS